MFQGRQRLQCRSSSGGRELLQPDGLQTCKQAAAVVTWYLGGRACSRFRVRAHAHVTMFYSCGGIMLDGLRDCNFGLSLVSHLHSDA
jgi:hypothetical protein